MKLLCVILLIFFYFTFNSVASEKITIASNSNSSPGWSEYSKYNGYILHIVTEAFAVTGIKVKINWYDAWKRAFEQAKNNKSNSSCCWFYVQQREKDFLYSDPVVEETQVFFHLKKYKFNWNTVNDLKGNRIGGNTGFHYGDSLDSAEKSGFITMDRARTYQQNFQKLLSNRIKLYPAATITAFDQLYSFFSQAEIEKITYHPKAVLTKNLHLILSKKLDPKKAKQLLFSFNLGLGKIKENGTYDTILKNSKKGFYRKMSQKWRGNPLIE